MPEEPLKRSKSFGLNLNSTSKSKDERSNNLNVFTQMWYGLKEMFATKSPKILPLIEPVVEPNKNENSTSASTTTEDATALSNPTSSMVIDKRYTKKDLYVDTEKNLYKNQDQSGRTERLVNLISHNDQIDRLQSNDPDIYLEITELLDSKKSVTEALGIVLTKYKKLENLTKLLQEVYNKCQTIIPLRNQIEQALVSIIFDRYKLLHNNDMSIKPERIFEEFQAFNNEVKILLNNKSLGQTEQIKYLAKSSFTVEQLRTLASKDLDPQLNKKIIEAAIVKKAIQSIDNVFKKDLRILQNKDNVSKEDPRVLKTLEYLQQNINNISIKETEKVIEEIGCRQEQDKVNITSSVWRDFLSEIGINKKQGEILNRCIEWLDALDKRAMYTINREDGKYIDIQKDIDEFLNAGNFSNKREIFNWMYFMVLYKFKQLGQEQNNNHLFEVIEIISDKIDQINSMPQELQTSFTDSNSSASTAMQLSPIATLMNLKKINSPSSNKHSR